eukprot:scaffold157507_cov30-Cyclotella_meneghiniana.AAC.1
MTQKSAIVVTITDNEFQSEHCSIIHCTHKETIKLSSTVNLPRHIQGVFIDLWAQTGHRLRAQSSSELRQIDDDSSMMIVDRA